jgi:DNA-binding NarL/FixJ family response regulator
VTRVAVVGPSSVRSVVTAALGNDRSVTVSAAASSVEELVSSGSLASADVLVLHGTSAQAVARRIDTLPPIPVIALLSGPMSPDAVSDILAGGARAVLSEASTAEELTAAVDAAAAGLTVVPSDLAETLVASARRRITRPALPSERRSDGDRVTLTRREREILGMLAEGLPNKAIASRLAISEHTVKTHVEALFDKLDASTRAEAVAKAVRTGMLLL